MTTIRAHYDGRVFVPDEELDLPAGQTVEVSVAPTPCAPPEVDRAIIEDRLRRLDAAAGHIKARTVPLEALRREKLHEEPV